MYISGRTRAYHMHSPGLIPRTTHTKKFFGIILWTTWFLRWNYPIYCVLKCILGEKTIFATLYIFMIVIFLKKLSDTMTPFALYCQGEHGLKFPVAVPKHPIQRTTPKITRQFQSSHPDAAGPNCLLASIFKRKQKD